MGYNRAGTKRRARLKRRRREEQRLAVRDESAQAHGGFVEKVKDVAKEALEKVGDAVKGAAQVVKDAVT